MSSSTLLNDATFDSRGRNAPSAASSKMDSATWLRMSNMEKFATMVRQQEFAPLDEDACADMFALTREMTAAAGLPAYEISNHARPGEESRHNLTYWRYQDYCGIGPGAHGRRGGVATTRHRKPEN